jgi:hypothetical protein
MLGLYIVLSKTNRIGDTKCIFSVVNPWFHLHHFINNNTLNIVFSVNTLNINAYTECQ